MTMPKWMPDGLARLREALGGTAPVAERLKVIAEMIELAAELSDSGDEGAEGAAQARAGLDEAVTRLRTTRAAVPAGSYEGLVTLSLLADACLVRDLGSDLDDAIGYLRQLRGELPWHDPELIHVETRLGSALFQRAYRSQGSPADVDDAGAAFTAALDQMAPEGPGRAELAAALALQRAVRYAGLGGTQDDRDAALSCAAQCLASSDAADHWVARCHLVIAWMALTRQLTSTQRSVMLGKPDLEAVRHGGAEAAALLAALGSMEVAVADAQTALRHLRQIRDVTVIDEELRGLVLVLSSVALLTTMREGSFTGDVDQVAGELERAARQYPPETLEQGELLAMRAALLTERAQGGNSPEDLMPTADALGEAAAQLPEGHPMRPALLRQLWETFDRQVSTAGSADDVAAEAERMVAALEQMPRDDPEFAHALTLIAVRVLSLRLSHRAAVPMERLSAQLERVVERLAPDDPVKPIGESMYWAVVGAQGAVEHRPDITEKAARGLILCADRTPADNAFRPYVLVGVAFALAEQYAMTGEMRHLEEAEKYVSSDLRWAGAAALLPESDAGYAMLFYARGFLKLARIQDTREQCDLAGAVRDIEQALRLMKPDGPLRPRLIAQLETARAMMAVYAGPGTTLGDPEREAFSKIMSAAQSVGRDHPDFPSLAGHAAAGLMLRGLSDGKTELIDQAIALVADACSVPSLTYRERPRLLDMHGSALLTRYHLTRKPRDLSNAIDRLEEARRAVEQEVGSPYAANVLLSLASAYRMRGNAARGDVERAVNLGLDALRERAGDVLLQDTDEHALGAAHRVTSDATEMARWFLGRDRPEAAISALELGRGTVLHAATSGAGLAEILRDAGHADLAAEWVREMPHLGAGNSEAASDLRYRIMLAIEGSPAETRLLAPPSLGDITAALRQCGVDALAYLLPRDEEGGPGLGVIVEPGGTVRSLPLPGLRTGPRSPVHAYLGTLRATTTVNGEMAEGAKGEWLASLSELCDWAWRAVIGPMLEALPARHRGSRRIVLVPTGELGLVAWHAARRRVGSGYRYACQEAAFSYASSARQLVDTARRQFRPWAQDPVLVSHTAASTYATEMGICHLYTACYPTSTVFGHAHTRLASAGLPAVSGAGAATSADVLAALPHGTAPGASLLHFGCHGRAEMPVLTSRLDLGQGEEVAVSRMLEQARTGASSASGGLVVLASCLTDVAEADYDEALTLATAFLSAGASGVIAARWKVPDMETALFMAIFHHYVNGKYPHPAQALRATQLWMLDPGRKVPDGLPTVLRDEAAQPALADPVAWAGFAYQGQ
jgi:hypothetical protein